MASLIEDEKIKKRNRNREHSNSDSTPTETETTSAQKFKLQQEEKSVGGRAKSTAGTKRRPTKVGLNDTLRRIRHLIIEGRNNLEIQSILRLNERTFYRYMAKINAIDNTLFFEQEKESLSSELGVFSDRLLQSYRWFRTMADNAEMNPSLRMEAQRNATEIAWSLTMLKFEGPRIMQKPGLFDNLYQNSSYQRLKRAEARKSNSLSSFSHNEEGEKEDDD